MPDLPHENTHQTHVFPGMRLLTPRRLIDLSSMPGQSVHRAVMDILQKLRFCVLQLVNGILVGDYKSCEELYVSPETN